MTDAPIDTIAGKLIIAAEDQLSGLQLSASKSPSVPSGRDHHVGGTAEGTFHALLRLDGSCAGTFFPNDCTTSLCAGYAREAEPSEPAGSAPNVGGAALPISLDLIEDSDRYVCPVEIGC